MTLFWYVFAAVLTAAIFASATKSHGTGVYVAGLIWPIAWAIFFLKMSKAFALYLRRISR